MFYQPMPAAQSHSQAQFQGQSAVTNALADSAGDRREGVRASTVLLIGKVNDGYQDNACLVLNLSEHGLMARLSFTPKVGQALEIELRGLPRCVAHVRWVNGMKAGMQFATRQNLEPVFCLMGDDGLVARAPRFDVELDAVVRLAGRQFAARIVNISPGGVRIVADTPVERGQTGQIVLPGHQLCLFGSVRWVHGNAFGMHFSTPLPLGNLRDCLEG